MENKRFFDQGLLHEDIGAKILHFSEQMPIMKDILKSQEKNLDVANDEDLLYYNKYRYALECLEKCLERCGW